MNFDDFQTEKSKSISWGKVGDFVTGTIINRSVNNQKDAYGNTAVIYEILVEGGVYHERERDAEGKIKKSTNPDAVEIKLAKGDIVSVWAKVYDGKRNSVLANQLERVPLGAYTRIVFSETQPSDKGNDAKIINAQFKKNPDGSYLLNEEWIKSQQPQFETEGGESLDDEF